MNQLKPMNDTADHPILVLSTAACIIQNPADWLFSTVSGDKETISVATELFIDLFVEDHGLVLDTLRSLQHRMASCCKRMNDTDPRQQPLLLLHVIQLLFESVPSLLMRIISKWYNDPNILVACCNTMRHLLQLQLPLNPTTETKNPTDMGATPTTTPFQTSTTITTPFGSTRSTTTQSGSTNGRPTDTGSRSVPYEPYCSAGDENSYSINIHNICAMEFFNSKSPEEIRYEDYFPPRPRDDCTCPRLVLLPDNQLTMMMRLVFLSMTNFTKQPKLQYDGIRTLTTILTYAVSNICKNPYTELISYLHYELLDRNTTDTESISSLIEYVTHTLKSYPDDIELHEEGSKFFSCIIYNSIALKLPISCSSQMVQLGVLATLSYAVEVCSADVKQTFALPALVQLSNNYQSYLLRNSLSSFGIPHTTTYCTSEAKDNNNGKNDAVPDDHVTFAPPHGITPDHKTEVVKKGTDLEPTTTDNILRNPIELLLFSSSSNNTDKYSIATKLFIDLFNDDCEIVITTLQSLIHDDINMNTLPLLLLESGLPIFVAVASQWYNNIEILIGCYNRVSQLLRYQQPATTATNVDNTSTTTTTTPKPIIPDSTLLIMIKLIILSMMNFPNHVDLQKKAIQTLTTIVWFLTQHGRSDRYNYTVQYLSNDTKIDEYCTKSTGTNSDTDSTTNNRNPCSVLKLVTMIVAKYPDEIQLQEEAGKFFHSIICTNKSSDGLVLPLSYTHRMVIDGGVLSLLSHMIKISPTVELQCNNLTTLNRLATDYRTYLNNNNNNLKQNDKSLSSR